MHHTRKIVLFLLISIVFAATLPACSSTESHTGLAMASMKDMPEYVQEAAVVVQEAYQFAAANPDLMKQVGCYCGCRDIGHTSNYDCYVAGVDGSGNLTYDNHAVGCSICVDITRDVMRMIEDGMPPGNIQSSIDAIYSRYGTSNLP